MNKKPTISIICALTKSNNAIGNKNQLLWHLSADLKNFKKITTGHPIIMGQLTYESINRPLPNRTNIILTKNPNYNAPGCLITTSIPQAIEKASEIDQEEIYIIGGGQIYAQTINLADKLYLTLVDDDLEADTFFPDYSNFKQVKKSETLNENDIQYQFTEWIKNKKKT